MGGHGVSVHGLGVHSLGMHLACLSAVGVPVGSCMGTGEHDVNSIALKS